MELNGLPLHPLVVHAAVVLGPIAAVAALAQVAVPRWRVRLQWPVAVLAVVAGLAVLAAYLTGNSFLESRPELGQLPQVERHEELGEVALWVTLGFALLAVAGAALRERTGAVRVVTDVLLGGAALATMVVVVLTGEAGARAVWGA